MRRYSSHRGISVGDGDGGIRRIQGVVIILLAIALAVSLILLLPGASARQTAHRYTTAQMLEECEEAVQQVARLSRTASSSSYDVLAGVRSEIYAIDTLNRAEQAVFGGTQMIPQNVFTSLYATLDSYYAKLITGVQTGDLQTELSAGLMDLHQRIEALQ